MIGGRPEAKPYVVWVRDVGGSVIEKRVWAYDLMEAMFAAHTEIAGDGGEVDITLKVEPDREELAKQRDQYLADSVTRDLLRSGLSGESDEPGG